MGVMIENVKKCGIPEGNDRKIAWNSKGMGYQRLDLLNSFFLEKTHIWW